MWFWLFIVSVVTNLFVLLYVRWLLTSLTIINTDIANVSEIIKDFSSHLNQIHEMEMFYGDETLKSLIDHSNILIETLKDVDLLLEEELEEEQVAKET